MEAARPPRENPITLTRYLLLLCSCVILSGCIATDRAPGRAAPVTDGTFGRYHENLEPDLIVITVTPRQHALLTGRKPVPLGVPLPPRYAAFLERLDAEYGLMRVANWPLDTIQVFCIVFQVRDPGSRDAIIAALSQEPGVETAQAVQTFDSRAGDDRDDAYDDPYLSMQHGVHSIQAIDSHRWTRGAGVRVAVIDTGMDDTHPDLASSSEATRNFVDDDEPGFRADTHGTAVGGVIAAETGNAAGMVGIAPDAALLALKACWHLPGDPDRARCNSLTLAKALNHSIQERVDVINLSLTGPPDALLERLVLEALAQGIVVVGARPAHQRAAFPVSVPGTLAVAMPSPRSGSISGPGHRVLSTRPDDRYDFFTGSSFSTAHVTGVVALLRSASPALKPVDLIALIEQTSDPDTGAANACRAVRAAQAVRPLGDDRSPDREPC